MSYELCDGVKKNHFTGDSNSKRNVGILLKSGKCLNDITTLKDLIALLIPELNFKELKEGACNPWDYVSSSAKRSSVVLSRSSGTTGLKKRYLYSGDFLNRHNKYWIESLEGISLEETSGFGVGSPEFWKANVETVGHAYNMDLNLFFPETREAKKKLEGLQNPSFPKKQFSKALMYLVRHVKGEAEVLDFQKRFAVSYLQKQFPSMVEGILSLEKTAKSDITFYVGPPEILLVPGLVSEKVLLSLENVVLGGTGVSMQAVRAVRSVCPDASIIPYFGTFLTGANFGVVEEDGISYMPDMVSDSNFNILCAVDDDNNIMREGRGRLVIGTVQKNGSLFIAVDSSDTAEATGVDYRIKNPGRQL